MLEVRRAKALDGRSLRLTLTDGSVVDRDITDLLRVPVFERLATDDAYFRLVRVRYGTVTWPGDIDLAPETIIWGNDQPVDDTGQHPPTYLRVPVPPR